MQWLWGLANRSHQIVSYPALVVLAFAIQAILTTDARADATKTHGRAFAFAPHVFSNAGGVSSSAGFHALVCSGESIQTSLTQSANGKARAGFLVVIQAGLMESPPPPDAISYPAIDDDGVYLVNWSWSVRAETYHLQRLGNDDVIWADVYTGPDTRCLESVGAGSCLYRVKATNDAGSSDYRVGEVKCVVPEDSPDSHWLVR